MGKIFVVYDSAYGNTEKIAQNIAQGFISTLDSQGEIDVCRVNLVKPDHLTGLDLLVVGSPTQRFRPTVEITTFLRSIPPNVLDGVRVAAFDTRLTEAEIGKIRILAFFVRIYGYAAKPIADLLKKKGGILVVPPEGFFVEGMEGPLADGEIQRAIEWGKYLVQS
jgi:flavodoxin